TEEPSPAETVDFKALNYTELIPIMIKAMQEQQQTIEQQQHSIGDLQQQVNDLKLALSHQTSNSGTDAVQGLWDNSKAGLDQNIPNPASQNTTFHYHLPADAANAQLIITNVNGSVVKSIVVNASDNGQITIGTEDLPAGTYNYSLIIDGRRM